MSALTTLLLNCGSLEAEREFENLLANAMRPPDVEAACEEITMLQKEITRLQVMILDFEIQLRFWRQAAEHAVNGWNALEDKYEDLLGRVRTLLKSEPQDPDAEAWLQLENFEDAREEWAPPTPVADPAPGLHVVDDETPR